MSLPWNVRQEIRNEVQRQLQYDPCDPCKNGGRMVNLPGVVKKGEMRFLDGRQEFFNGTTWEAISGGGGSSSPAPSVNTGFPYSFPIQL